MVDAGGQEEKQRNGQTVSHHEKDRTTGSENRQGGDAKKSIEAIIGAFKN